MNVDTGSVSGLLIVLLALGFAAPGLSQEEAVNPPPANVVWLLDAKGRVDVLHLDRRQAGRPNQPLVPADHVQTWADSRANLLWYDRVHFQVSELSDITIPPPPGPQQRSTLEVMKGFLYFFHRGKPREIEIKTPTAAAIVVGTEFSVRVEANGRTVLRLFDGDLEIGNPQGQARMTSSEQATIEPGQAPSVTPIVEGLNDLIQWFLYYPGVLNVDEAGLTPAEEQALAASLAAYRSGDLRAALGNYPMGRQPGSDAERVYLAALLLSVGQVNKAETLLTAIAAGDHRTTALAAALRKLIAAVKGQVSSVVLDTRLATAGLAESYYRQSRGELSPSLAAATNAVFLAPQFGFGWARVAELEFGFGRTKPALAAVERASMLSPRNAEALALKGFLLSAQNKIPQALELFDRAIAQDGGLGNGWLGRGLCRIRQGDAELGRQDLLVAAAVEPQRSLLRSYLGKALSDAGERNLALHELQLARRLDPNDPTAFLYSALLKEQDNQANEAVRDLGASQALNDNRSLFRSRLLLDQDRAVRAVNLARIYGDVGMFETGIREAARAVNFDYANYSAHLFLANSYQQLRDPKQVDLRYETAAFSEYLVANLLAPVGAGTLSPTVSQQEYSKLFERDGLRLASSTEYLSRGDWIQSAAQHGLFGHTSYSLEAGYRSENGQRPNNDQEQLDLSLEVKQQVTPQDTGFFQGICYRARGGDLAQHYDPAQGSLGYRFNDTQDPVLLGGWHREWNPGSHTLLLAARVQDTFEVSNTNQPVPYLYMYGGQIALVPSPFAPPALLNYRNELAGYTAELQQLFQQDKRGWIAGGRFQAAEFDTVSQLGESGTSWLTNASGVGTPVPGIPAGTYERHPHLLRFSAYGYHNWHVLDPLVLTAGVSYDWVRYPANHRTPPTSDQEEQKDQISPKVGLVWQPEDRTVLRGAYTRSLGGATLDQSYRLEPSQVAGFNQAFRSLAPESVVGSSLVASFETAGASLERRFGAATYLGVEAEWLQSRSPHQIGSFSAAYPNGSFEFTPASIQQDVDFRERSLLVTWNQLAGREWAFGARYRLSLAEVNVAFPDIPPASAATVHFKTHADLEAVLHQLNLFAIFNHRSGFFAQAQARGYAQDNRRDSAVLPDADFWQFDVFAGWRLARRRAEVRVGVLNLTGRDYRLNPLNLLPELPRQRTFTASLRFNF